MKTIYTTGNGFLVVAALSNGNLMIQERKEAHGEMALAAFAFDMGQLHGDELDENGDAVEIVAFHVQSMRHVGDALRDALVEFSIEKVRSEARE